MAIEREDILYLVAEEYLNEYQDKHGLEDEELPKEWIDLVSKLVDVLTQACDEEFNIFQSTHLEEE